MARITVDKAQPGQVLSEDLRSETGRFLMGKGTTLTDKHCRIFRIWGVTSLEVVGDQGEDDRMEASPVQLLEAKTSQSSRYAQSNKSLPLVREMFRQSVLLEAARLAKGGLACAVPSQADDTPMPERDELDAAKVVRETMTELGTMPTILSELVETINNPRSSSMDIARIVEKDTALAAKLLRIVNSPFYGFPSRIDTISRAVTIVGSKQLTTLAAGVAAISFFSGIPNQYIDMRSFWSHSLRTGFAARLLAAHATTQNPERFFVAGLLHDIGRLVLLRLRPESYARVLEYCSAHRVPAEQVERKIFGFDHGVLAGHLLKEWKFPISLEDSVAHHHSPRSSTSTLDPTMVHVANFVATGLEVGTCAIMPRVDDIALSRLKMPEGAVTTVAQQTEYLFEQTASYFLQDGAA